MVSETTTLIFLIITVPPLLISSSPIFTLPFLLLSSSSSSPLTGWNVAVWASVNCGLSAVVASNPKAQSQQGWAVAACRCTK